MSWILADNSERRVLPPLGSEVYALVDRPTHPTFRPGVVKGMTINGPDGILAFLLLETDDRVVPPEGCLLDIDSAVFQAWRHV